MEINQLTTELTRDPDWLSLREEDEPGPAQETVNISSESELETVNELQFKAVAEPTPAPKTERRWVAPGLIRLDGNTQSRAIRLDRATVDRYAEEMREGRWNFEREPLPVVFDDCESLWASDIHHRAAAALKANTPEMLVEIRPGTERDARIYSVSANKYHGLPRSNADKRAAVELLLADSEWQLKSDRALAEHCGVSAPFVAKVRAELAASGTVNAPAERIDKLGRKIDTTKIGVRPKSLQLEPEEPVEAAVSLSISSEPLTPMPPIAKAPAPKVSQNADRAAQIQAEIQSLKARLSSLEAELAELECRGNVEPRLLAQ